MTQNGSTMTPFNLRVSSLVESVVKSEVELLKDGSSFVLTKKPTNAQDANGACCAYLSGTSKYYRDRLSDELKNSKEFKLLGVKDFRTKSARELRDRKLSEKSCSFLNQAFRYRGKANYREALFLGYGSTTEHQLSNYVDDLYAVLAAFVSMAGAFSSKRLGKQIWSEFMADVEAKRSFSLDPRQIWE